MSTEKPGPKKTLVLEIEVPDIWADDLDESVAMWADEGTEATAEDRLFLVTEEWMREEAIVVLTTIPGEKCMNDEFEVIAKPCRIVGARTVDRA